MSEFLFMMDKPPINYVDNLNDIIDECIKYYDKQIYNKEQYKNEWLEKKGEIDNFRSSAYKIFSSIKLQNQNSSIFCNTIFLYKVKGMVYLSNFITVNIDFLNKMGINQKIPNDINSFITTYKGLKNENSPLKMLAEIIAIKVNEVYNISLIPDFQITKSTIQGTRNSSDLLNVMFDKNKTPSYKPLYKDVKDSKYPDISSIKLRGYKFPNISNIEETAKSNFTVRIRRSIEEYVKLVKDSSLFRYLEEKNIDHDLLEEINKKIEKIMKSQNDGKNLQDEYLTFKNNIEECLENLILSIIRSFSITEMSQQSEVKLSGIKQLLREEGVDVEKLMEASKSLFDQVVSDSKDTFFKLLSEPVDVRMEDVFANAKAPIAPSAIKSLRQTKYEIPNSINVRFFEMLCGLKKSDETTKMESEKDNDATTNMESENDNIINDDYDFNSFLIETQSRAVAPLKIKKRGRKK